ncbi:RVT_3 domain-containing protein [Cephalotus follicularis]|uniref:RVT_3 domain-containing protein n=1 Tax=Cephalotus follicularis TaxID=3775 RepID=A0A1Q3B5E1_CEPFO|nr:RVT_3 domain-containing protein [Cephalotus follicularis]
MNNEAEYEALISGLKVPNHLQVQNLVTHTNSQLVANQINGSFKAKDLVMASSLKEVNLLKEKFQAFQVIQIRREENGTTDALSKLATLEDWKDSRVVLLETLSRPSIAKEKQVNNVAIEASWMDPILASFKEGYLPEQASETRKIKYRSLRYVRKDYHLYKRPFIHPFFKFLRPIEARYLLEEVQEGTCGNHVGGRILAQKILRQGLY